MDGTSPNLDKKIAAIREALAYHLADQENETLAELDRTAVIRRPFSTVVFLRARTSLSVRRFVMKTTVHHPINKFITERENQAEVEYNVMMRLYPKFQEVERCSVPRPVLLLPELDTYLMEFVEAHLLSDELRYSRYFSSKRKFGALTEHFYNCGRWLKNFQKFTGAEVAGAEIMNTSMERCAERLKLIEDANHPCCPKGLRSIATRLLHEEMRRLSGMDIVISGRHSDFTTYNVLCGPKGITVIDFLGYLKDVPSEDILSMLVHLEDEKRCLSSSAWRVESLMKSFLEGFGEIPPLPKAVLVISESMQRVISLWGHISNSKGWLHHRMEANMCIKAQVDWLTAPGEKRLLLPSI